MNKVILRARLCKDAEISYSQSGTAIIKMNVANNSGWGDNKRVNFVNCVMFKREKLIDHLKKGVEILIEGELSFSQWEHEGQKRSKLEVIVGQLEFISSKDSNGQETAENDSEIPF